MRRFAVRWTVVAAVMFTVFSVGLRLGEVQSAQQANDARLKKLLDERYEAKRQIVEILKKPGHSSKIEQFHATIEMLSAEFDTCESKAQKLSVLEKILNEEKSFEVMMRSANTSYIDNLRNRIRRLEAEIALEREKLN